MAGSVPRTVRSGASPAATRSKKKLFYSNPRLARHLSVFGESIAFSEAIEWLKTLRFRQLESAPEGALLDASSTL
jgi:hypothetical protein